MLIFKYVLKENLIVYLGLPVFIHGLLLFIKMSVLSVFKPPFMIRADALLNHRLDNKDKPLKESAYQRNFKHNVNMNKSLKNSTY